MSDNLKDLLQFGKAWCCQVAKNPKEFKIKSESFVSHKATLKPDYYLAAIWAQKFGLRMHEMVAKS